MNERHMNNECQRTIMTARNGKDNLRGKDSVSPVVFERVHAKPVS